VFEQPMENPFLERFYKDRRAAAFPAQLYFLFQRARQLAELRQHDLFAQVRIADYMLEKDRLFARIVLDDEEFKLYEQVYARLAMDAPTPDLVVFLHAPVDILLQRIDRRGIPFEKYIDAAYLERLGDAYTRYFHQYTASPLLIVNTAEIDPANNSRDFEDLFETIRRTTSGRHYVNPLRG
jgi:deoxyguanosine kinase